MSSQIILYDLPSRQGTAWSLNPWKSNINFLVLYSDAQTNRDNSPHGAELQKNRLQDRIHRIPRPGTNIQILVHRPPYHHPHQNTLTPTAAASLPTTPTQSATIQTTPPPPCASLTAPTSPTPGPSRTSSKSGSPLPPCTSPTPSSQRCATKSPRS